MSRLGDNLWEMTSSGDERKDKKRKDEEVLLAQPDGRADADPEKQKRPAHLAESAGGHRCGSRRCIERGQGDISP